MAVGDENNNDTDKTEGLQTVDYEVASDAGEVDDDLQFTGKPEQVKDKPEQVKDKPAPNEKGLEEKINLAVQEALVGQSDSVLRAQADVQNMRRRCEADVERAHKFALEKFSIELFSVMDNMERALQVVPDKEIEEVKGLCNGIELTMKGLLEVFSKFNIEQIDPEGEPFDPQVHQAMSMIENKEVEPNTIIGVMQKGYSLNGRVVRPAMVMVSKA